MTAQSKPVGMHATLPPDESEMQIVARRELLHSAGLIDTAQEWTDAQRLEALYEWKRAAVDYLKAEQLEPEACDRGTEGCTGEHVPGWQSGDPKDRGLIVAFCRDASGAPLYHPGNDADRWRAAR